VASGFRRIRVSPISFQRGTGTTRRAVWVTVQKSNFGTGLEGRCEATWKREFKLPWREAGPPTHHDDKVDSDQQVVNKKPSLLGWDPVRALQSKFTEGDRSQADEVHWISISTQNIGC